ncbi:MAG TPA: hypothetical protein VN428_01465, partial [Bryobacteraceae bacterium]|nr:hypothetical protein [Bryobacteraceae bacterium]
HFGFRGGGGGFRGRIRGFAGFHGFRRFGGFGFGGSAFIGSGFYPYAYYPSYPLFVGGYYGGYYPPAAAYPQAPNVTVIYLPPYGEPEDEREDREEEVRREVTPEVREYTGRAAEAAPRREQITFEIAMKDGPVHSALAYWVEEGALNFIDIEGKRHSVNLAAVDRKRSEELNRAKQVEFRLPAER